MYDEGEGEDEDEQDGDEDDAKEETFNFYEVEEYESAGVWRDSEGKPCLVIQARYEGEADAAVHMLYEESRRTKLPKDSQTTQSCLWVVMDAGRGGHLSGSMNHKHGVKCNNPCKVVARAAGQ